MIKILFDHQTFSLQRFGGISRYFANIVSGIKAQYGIAYQLGLLYSKNYYLENEEQPLDNFFFRWLLRKDKRRAKWNKFYSKHLLKKNNFDVFHATYYHPYFLKHLKKPLVVTVHDMTHEALPSYFPNVDPLTWQKRMLVEKADKIIVISENTKKDLIKYLAVDAEKIEVIYHGVNQIKPVYEQVADLPAQYLLFVGERGGYKNFFMLAEAFKNLTPKYPSLRLVLAGGGAFTVGDREFLIRNNILDKTIQLSVNDAQLNTLYKNASCFIFPSLYEGFGFPILEAFKNDCPVLLSNCSCFEEIAGNDAARYFDHQSVKSLETEIEIVINDDNIKSRLKDAGRKRLLDFPIQKCTDKTVELYKKLVK